MGRRGERRLPRRTVLLRNGEPVVVGVVLGHERQGLEVPAHDFGTVGDQVLEVGSDELPPLCLQLLVVVRRRQ